MNKVENYTNTINKPLSIAIMGCSVNGIGECKHANIGVYGSKDKLFLYENGKLIKQIKHQNALIEIKNLIKI
jgi:(E)-4-hydroxy-3-methylbut-2-enyl-diphosphate synthase